MDESDSEEEEISKLEEEKVDKNKRSTRRRVLGDESEDIE